LSQHAGQQRTIKPDGGQGCEHFRTKLPEQSDDSFSDTFGTRRVSFVNDHCILHEAAVDPNGVRAVAELEIGGNWI